MRLFATSTWNFLRLVFLFLAAALSVAPQQAPAKAAEEDGFSSLINGPDLAGWEGNQHAWKLDDGVLVGRSDGPSPAILVVSGREFGDFELRFEARVHRGAVRVKMHGPVSGPLGVALEINSATVEWFHNSKSAFVVANNRPDEWKEYRVSCSGTCFQGVAKRNTVRAGPCGLTCGREGQAVPTSIRGRAL